MRFAFFRYQKLHCWHRENFYDDKAGYKSVPKTKMFL